VIAYDHQFKAVVPKWSSSVQQVKDSISKDCGVAPQDLALCEVFRGNVHHLFASFDRVTDIHLGDDIRAFELAHSSAPADDLFVCVLNRYKRTFSSAYSSTYLYTEGMPRFVRLNKKKLSVGHVLKRIIESFKCVGFESVAFICLVCVSLL
jgi:hypothetical protein